MKLETAPPLTEEEYARTFNVCLDISDEYEAMANMAGRFISENKFDENPVKMLSVGAGRGDFETHLVKEKGLKLDYICAIEPNGTYLKELKPALKSLGGNFDISSCFFNKKFQFDKDKVNKFDFILFANSLYGFDDPHGAVLHATKFLNPGGKMLIINQGGGASSEIYTYLTNKSDPEIFSPKKCIGNHGLTADEIISELKKSSKLKILTMRERIYEDVDDFVRRTDNPKKNYKIDFSLQAEYDKLSEEARTQIYNMVKDKCDVVQGRYKWRHWCVGINVSSGTEW